MIQPEIVQCERTAEHPVAEMRAVQFSYGPGEFAIAVDEFQLNAGERVACIGPSGSGKTTLINLIAGISLPERGEVRLDGRPLGNLSDRERRALRLSAIGMIFQEFALLDYLNGLDNILLPFRVGSDLVLNSEVRRRAHDIASEMGIEGVLRRPPSRMSQGERQRLAICRALVTQPRLLLCDEPTGNLDPTSTDTILDMLFEQAQQRDAAIFMVTHDYSMLSRFDRTVDVMELHRAAAEVNLQ